MYQSNYKRTFAPYSRQNNQFTQEQSRCVPNPQSQGGGTYDSTASTQQKLVPPPVPATPAYPVATGRGNGNQDERSQSQQRRAKNVFFTNSFSIAGRICERGLQLFKDKVARFVIAFNDRKDGDCEPLYTECVMFAPKGGTLPDGLFVKGKPVVASGFRRASTWVDSQGAKHYQVDHVVTHLQEILPDGTLK